MLTGWGLGNSGGDASRRLAGPMLSPASELLGVSRQDCKLFLMFAMTDCPKGLDRSVFKSSSSRDPQSAGSMLASSFCNKTARNEDPGADRGGRPGAVNNIY